MFGNVLIKQYYIKENIVFHNWCFGKGRATNYICFLNKCMLSL